jgi:hypothetical protein
MFTALAKLKASSPANLIKNTSRRPFSTHKWHNLKQQPTKLSNLVYFHKRRILVFFGFSASYGVACYSMTNFPVEAVRLGVAGSLANMICETGFHIIDTVNIRSKVSDSATQSSTLQQVKKIYVKEGLYGFGRGFSACYYGSIFCGFSYFFLYK